MAKSGVDVDGEPAARWRARLQRFAHAGSSVAAFCAAEGVSAWSFYRWRRKLAGAAAGIGAPAVAGVKPKASSAPASGFIDAGVARLIIPQAAAAAPLEVRIELGGGIVLRILRG